MRVDKEQIIFLKNSLSVKLVGKETPSRCRVSIGRIKGGSKQFTAVT